jgi:chemotaxis protein MotB
MVGWHGIREDDMYGPQTQTPAHYPSYGVPHDPAYRMKASPRSSSRLPWLLLILVLVSVVYAGQLAWKEHARLTALVAQGEASEQARRALETRLQGLTAERAELAAARDSLQKSVEAKASEIAELKGTFENLQEKMKEEIAKGEIALSQTGGRLKVDMVDKILFESGSAEVSRRGASVLARVGGVLAKIGEKQQLQVSGHTDNQPISRKLRRQFPTNWELSIGRAMNVVRFLQDQAGVPGERLVASGYGEHHPLASNRSNAGRARNRRIEILLTPELAPQRLSAAKSLSR